MLSLVYVKDVRLIVLFLLSTDLLDGKDAQKLIYKVIEGLREDQIGDLVFRVLCLT